MMMKPILRSLGPVLAMTLALTVSPLFAEERMPPRKASPITVMQVHSGHSLSDTYGSAPWPGRLIMATDTVNGARPYDTIFRSIIPGSPLRWRWDNPSSESDARKNIGKFELLVTTEATPLSPNEEYFKSDSLRYLDIWVDHAWKKGNRGKGAEVMLYSTWVTWKQSDAPSEDDPEANLPFRQRLDLQAARWEWMQDHANANRPDGMPLIYMIPGHRLMMRIYDDIEAGKAPFTSIDQIFSDDIHLNDIGQYAITCLVYAVIYQRDPNALPDRLVDEDTLSRKQARYLKQIAWDVAKGYHRSGVPAN
jgi:hypothetical protein